MYFFYLIQIVAGVNYKIKLGIGYTTCKKSQTKYDDIDACDFQEVSGFVFVKKINVFIFL